MRTISHFLGRKGVAAAVVPVAAPAQQGTNGIEGRGEVTFADLGTRIGEDNETLRNLLLDTDRRLTSLDELKVTFRSLVEPIGAALRSLEQEKTDNVTLRNALAELRTSHDTVRKESHTFERQVGELANDNASLRRELALAQQATKDLETERAELASELLAARSEIAKLDSQLAQETANGRALGEANQILADHGSSADRRIVELQGDCSLARENLLLLENDKHSLQSALDQTLAENSRLSRRLTESESALTAARARLEQMEISLAAAEKERAALSAARDEDNERHQSECYALNLRLEALRSRASTAEKLLAEVRQSLVARTEEIRASERKLVEASIARNATDKTIERLTAARDALDAKVSELDQARATLRERGNGLSETLKARDSALANAEQKIKSLTDRFEQLELDAGAYRAKAEKRIEDLHNSVQRGRAELAVAQGALDTTRRDFARLQRGFAPERAALEEGSDTPAVDAPKPNPVVDTPKPKEPPRSRNGRSAGRGIKTAEAKPEGNVGEPPTTR
jgi:crescentin